MTFAMTLAYAAVLAGCSACCSARSSTWWPTGCRAASRWPSRLRTARPARRRSSPTTTSRCSPGCGSGPLPRVPRVDLRALPAVEAVTAALLVAVVLAKGADSDAWLGLAFVLLLVPVTLIDLDHRIIPNKLMLRRDRRRRSRSCCSPIPTSLTEHLIAAAAPAASCSSPRSPIPRAWAWATSSSRASWASSSAAPSAPAMLVALVAGSVVGALDHRPQGRQGGPQDGASRSVPYLAFGGIVGLFAGDPIVEWYLDTFA